MTKLAIIAMVNGLATLLLATATLTTLATLVGLAGGIAGFWALWRVSGVARDLNEFLAGQARAITSVLDEAEPPPDET